ncbi:MAG: glycosyltransferase family 9 protein [Candidatus Omnitrophica bacterium]|jgi:ADP-heptose:LPS heptosyltransferase|nr:glycosyltransferase family 9 protein [Candidatus Omnitrophota bacterium]
MIEIDNPVNKKIALVLDCIGKIIFYSGRFLGLWDIKKNELTKINPQKILVIEEEPLGDVIISIPIFAALKYKFPSARMSVLVSSIGSEILKNNPYIDEIIVESCPWVYSKQINFSQAINCFRYLKHYQEISKLLKSKNFDLGIDLRGDIRNIIFFLFLPKVKYTLSYDRTGGAYLLSKPVFFDASLHIIQRKINLLKQIGIEKIDKKIQIYYCREDIKKAEEVFESYGLRKNDFFAIIHPGASQNKRLWSLNRYAKVADFIKNKYAWYIILTGSKEEAPLTEKIVKLMQNNKVINLCGRLNISELSILLGKASLLVCPDTSIMHLACISSVPTVAIFGPADPDITGPCQKNVYIVKKDYFCKRPCSLSHCKHTKNGISACMDIISIEEVTNAIDFLLTKIERA